MTAEMNSSVLTLERRELIEFAEYKGGTITCLTGSLWVTRLGSSRDTVLQASESMTVDESGSVVVQGLARSALRIALCRAPVNDSLTRRMHRFGSAIRAWARLSIAAGEGRSC